MGSLRSDCSFFVRFSHAVVVAFAMCSLVLSCGPGDTVEITGVRVVPAGSDPVLPGASSGERFDRSRSHVGHDHEATRGSRSTISWDLPEGWEQLPANGAALARFRPGDTPGTEPQAI